MLEYLKDITGIGREVRKRIPLNKIFFYDMLDSRLFLHLNTSSVPAKELTPVKFNNFYKEALRQLAENLQKVETIIARSGIVRDHPEIFTRAGFVSDLKDPTLASISKDDFLNRAAQPSFYSEAGTL